MAVPDAESWREFIGPVLLVGISGFSMAALAIGAVLVFSVFLARGIGKLAEATKAVGEGAVRLPRFRVRELALVGEGLQRAGAKIAEDNALSRVDLGG